MSRGSPQTVTMVRGRRLRVRQPPAVAILMLFPQSEPGEIPQAMPTGYHIQDGAVNDTLIFYPEMADPSTAAVVHSGPHSRNAGTTTDGCSRRELLNRPRWGQSCRSGDTAYLSTRSEPILYGQLINRLPKNRVNIGVNVVGQSGRRVLEQPLCHGS